MSKVTPAGLIAFSGLATGKSRPMGLCVFSVAALPTDPIGSTTVTFQGVLDGTEIHVYLHDGTELTGVESSTVNPVLTWPVYAPGANSTVYITLIKRGYRWQRFDYTSRIGLQTIQIFPLPDLGYNNPS